MRLHNNVAAIAVLHSALAQIPPSSFGLPSAPTQLLLSFQNGKVQTTPGVHFGVDIPVDHEQGLIMPIDPSEMESASIAGITSALASVLGTQSYLIVMIDPDASTPQNPSNAQLLHWLEGGYRLVEASTASSFSTAPFSYILFNNETTNPAAVPYARPAPPPFSDAHRYIQYLFREPSDFQIPEAFQGFSARNRSHFNITNFIQASGLGSPVAANYFYCSNMSAVPPTYSAPPSANFPSVTSSPPMPSGVAGSTGSQVAPTRSTNTLMPIYTGKAEKIGIRTGVAMFAAAVAATFGMG